MPSIPQSLLWISLVVLWLFVLVPMLVNKRDSVKRTSDVALATRVLNTGSRAARLLRRRGPAAGHASDPHWRRDEDDDEFDDYDDDATGPVVVTAKPRTRTVAVVTSLPEEEPDYLDVDIVEEDSGALPVGAVREAPQTPQEDELPLEFASTETESAPESASEPEQVEVVEVAEVAVEPEPEPEPVHADAEPEAEAVEPEPVQAEAEAVEEEPVFEGADGEYEYVEDASDLESESESAPQAVPLAHERRPSKAAAAAAAADARKYRFRKNVLLCLAVAMVASAASAFLLTPTAWWLFGVTFGVTVLYLAYLRRQTRIEEQLRRRRRQRMARTRLLGVENTYDREMDVVPARLRRPGTAVLEIDDEDPAFEHLEHVPFARHFDLPRASGQ